MRIEVDRSIYSDECISKCVYSMLAEFDIERNLSDGIEIIEIESKAGLSDEITRSRFLSCLNDYKVRDVVSKETHDIRVILYAKAFADNDDYNENV